MFYCIDEITQQILININSLFELNYKMKSI